MSTPERLRRWPWALIALWCGCRSGGMSQARREPDLPSSAVVHGPVLAAVRSSDREPHLSELGSDESEIQLTAAEAIPEADSALTSPKNLSLTDCLAHSLTQNPDLIALRQNDSVSSAALGVAQTYPFNPSVQVQVTPWQNAKVGGPGGTYHYVLLMQNIQLANQQQYREAGAASTLNSARWNIHQAELRTVAQTERLYFSALYLRGILQLATAIHENNQSLLRTLEKQLEAGAATAADAAIVRVDARSTHQQLRLAKANFETAQRDLRRQIGLLPDDTLPIEGDLRQLSWRVPALEDAARTDGDMEESTLTSPVVRTMISGRAWSRPDVMAAQSDAEAARAAMCLATANRTPDLQIGPYYQRTADGTSFLGFRGQMDVPVINSGRPLENQRIAELNQRVTAWHQLQRRAELEAQAAWERFAQAIALLHEDASDDYTVALPEELQSLEQRFLEGEIDVLRVVQARTSLIQNQRANLDLLNEVAQAAANLTETTGIPLEELLHTIPSPTMPSHSSDSPP